MLVVPSLRSASPYLYVRSSMFSEAASKYWGLYCHVGGTNDATVGKVHGLGCRLTASHILTAQHVFDDYAYPTVALSDGIWKCKVVKAWPDQDIALLRKTKLVKPTGEPENEMAYPTLARELPDLGCSLGYIGWLAVAAGRVRGKTRGRNAYFGSRAFGFFEFSESAPDHRVLLAVAGSAVQQGFSGGPVFTHDGVLIGVLVKSLQYVPNLAHEIRTVNSLPLVAPIGKISLEISRLLQDA